MSDTHIALGIQIFDAVEAVRKKTASVVLSKLRPEVESTFGSDPYRKIYQVNADASLVLSYMYPQRCSSSRSDATLAALSEESDEIIREEETDQLTKELIVDLMLWSVLSGVNIYSQLDSHKFGATILLEILTPPLPTPTSPFCDSDPYINEFKRRARDSHHGNEKND